MILYLVEGHVLPSSIGLREHAFSLSISNLNIFALEILVHKTLNFASIWQVNRQNCLDHVLTFNSTQAYKTGSTVKFPFSCSKA